MIFNDQGDVVVAGSGFDASLGFAVPRAFYWHNGQFTDLGVHTPIGSRGVPPLAINNHGQIVGTAFTDDGGSRAFLWQNGHVTLLGPDGSLAWAINDRGQVVLTGAGHTFVWQAGQIVDLGAFRGPPIGKSINQEGQIIGGPFTMEDSSGSRWFDHYGWTEVPVTPKRRVALI